MWKVTIVNEIFEKTYLQFLQVVFFSDSIYGNIRRRIEISACSRNISENIFYSFI